MATVMTPGNASTYNEDVLARSTYHEDLYHGASCRANVAKPQECHRDAHHRFAAHRCDAEVLRVIVVLASGLLHIHLYYWNRD